MSSNLLVAGAGQQEQVSKEMSVKDIIMNGARSRGYRSPNATLTVMGQGGAALYYLKAVKGDGVRVDGDEIFIPIDNPPTITELEDLLQTECVELSMSADLSIQKMTITPKTQGGV